MSKYNLTDIHEDILKEGMSRGGTINDSFFNIANTADELEGKNEGKDTYPIQVKRLGASEDGKTNEEIVIRYGDGHRDYFSIYDYKFGEDPTDEDNYQKEYPFSLGIPTGNKDGKRYAMKLGFNVEGMPKSDADLEEKQELEELSGEGGVDALTALLGAGGLTAGAFALNKIMDALEKGKLGDKGKTVAKHLRDMGATFRNGGASMVEEGDPIVDEHEFNFFQTILDGRYQEEDIEEYLKSDDYQQALETLNLDASDTEEWIGEFANYFGDGADAYIDEDQKLKEHFSRFLKNYQ